MIGKLVQTWLRVRRLVSRTRWTAAILKRPHVDATDRPGLIVLQIDGLAHRQFEQALAKGRLPYLHKMVECGHYRSESFYSGCPSTTPAVQGEVMYGQRCAVPAFQFLDRASRRVVRMFDAEPAHAVAKRLAAEQEPLPRGGKSYSNIYSGGAAEARFCAETLVQDQQRLLARPSQWLLVGLMYFSTVLRVAALAMLEFAIALGDLVRGVFEREDWWTELKYIPSRVGVSIVLREYLRVMVKLAIEEGSPVIYANFLGYDEQAHRRGPDSWFAHWVLKGIDGVIADISRTARRSPRRDYEVVVFSDHGQERTRFYDHIHHRSIQDAARDAFDDGPLAGRTVRPLHPWRSGGKLLHARARHMLRPRKAGDESPHLTATELAQDIIVTAMGPLGHIYIPTAIGDDVRDHYAQRLVENEGVPLVVYRDDAGDAWARNSAGRWSLPGEAEHVLGAEHPFLHEATEDLISLCRHPDAGDLVISGWEPGRQPMTFVMENGSHGSVGADEVRGFALVPDAVRIERRRTAAGMAYVRGEDLYWAGRAFLGRADECDRGPARVLPTSVRAEARDSFRAMTYNIHSCIGLDGRVSPERILQVIRSSGADVIALQEVDSNRPRSKHADQAKFLAERLEMSHHFYAVLEEGGQQYGLAIISRWPLKHVQSSHLTAANPQRRCEARGALWVEVDAPWGPVQVINTHWGLLREERRRQAAMLAGDDWLGRLKGNEQVVICGDLNSGARSPEYRVLSAKFRDAQLSVTGHRPGATFPSPYPLRRLDHILVSGSLTVERIVHSRTPTAVIASDHLPVCVDLAIPRENATRGEDDPSCEAATADSLS